jgi:hypothetical protein
MKKYKISMGNPCSFGWQNMVSNEQGRFCSQCNKTVVDFTIMSDEEVVKYLLTHQGVCGHFNKTQLGRTMAAQGIAPSTKKYWPAIAAMLVAGVFQLMPLVTYANNNAQKPTNLYPLENLVEPGGTGTLHPQDQDSLTTFRLQIISSKNKKPIEGAQVNIEGAGQFISDAKGYITIHVVVKNMPDYFRITAFAPPDHSYDRYIHLKDFIKNPFYQLELQYNDPNLQVDGGEIYIEPQ